MRATTPAALAAPGGQTTPRDARGPTRAPVAAEPTAPGTGTPARSQG